MIDYHLEIGERSADSAAMLGYWEKVTDIVSGEDAVRAQGEKYLPKFANEDDPTYKFRLSCGKFTNIYNDVLEGLASKPFEDEIKLVGESIPSQISQFIEDVDGSGNNLTGFATGVFYNGINSAVDWILVDYPSVSEGERPRNQAEQKQRGDRPYWSRILAQNVLEVRSKNLNGTESWTLFRIWEPGDPDNHVRIFKRDGDVVTWELWVEKTQPQKHYEQIDGGTLTIGVIPVVPFIPGRRDGRRYYFYPPMKAAADLQMNLYRTESALEWIKALAGFPMLSGEGIAPERDAAGNPIPIRRGPSVVLFAPPGNGPSGPHGSWKFVEPSAENMKFLKDDANDTKQDLRELGRQPLTAQSGQLTTTTTAVAAGKARSAVSAWALSLKNALENALVITALWFNVEYDPEVNVFTEFDDFLESAGDLDTLNTAREKRDLSQETYWSELQRRKVLSPEFDPEAERERLLSEEPAETELNDNNSI